MMPGITMIAAASENNALGKDNQLLWHLPDDFRRFKRLTSGHMIIMGRKTFESFGKPLPNRTHIICTRDKDYRVPYPECQVVHSLIEAINRVGGNSEPYIIGGGEIYAQGLKFADTIELTRVHGTFEADTFFPEIDEKEWKLVKTEYHPQDEKHAHDFTYLTYERK